ncbi:MAG: hypothetical protein LBQ12_03405 [Deltaproteobacteria bacterium]|nr:hypothetical protein [Deltaproteobacteria bacterium]
MESARGPFYVEGRKAGFAGDPAYALESGAAIRSLGVTREHLQLVAYRLAAERNLGAGIIGKFVDGEKGQGNELSHGRRGGQWPGERGWKALV